MQVLGCDVLDGSPSQLQGYVNTTGSTFPFLLRCYAGPPTGNFVLWYGDRDNYVVVNKQGIVRYRAAQTHPYSQGFHLDEIRGCIDSLVTLPGTDAGATLPRVLSLAASPNPCRGGTELTLALPQEESRVRIEVTDLSGRVVRVLWDAPRAAGRLQVSWDARDERGTSLPPGVFFVSARVGSRIATARVAVVR